MRWNKMRLIDLYINNQQPLDYNLTKLLLHIIIIKRSILEEGYMEELTELKTTADQIKSDYLKRHLLTFYNINTLTTEKALYIILHEKADSVFKTAENYGIDMESEIVYVFNNYDTIFSPLLSLPKLQQVINY